MTEEQIRFAINEGYKQGLLVGRSQKNYIIPIDGISLYHSDKIIKIAEEYNFND